MDRTSIDKMRAAVAHGLAQPSGLAIGDNERLYLFRSLSRCLDWIEVELERQQRQQAVAD